MPFVCGVLENLISEFIFILILIFLGWFFLRITRQRTLHRFFLTNKNKRVSIYLSNLQVIPFGAIGIDGMTMSYQGTAADYGEMESANKIRDLFSLVVPSITDEPGFLDRVLLSDVKVQLTVSPLDPEDLEAESSVISFGSGAFNTMSKFIEDELEPLASFRYGILKEEDSHIYTQTQRPTAFSTDSEVHIISPSGVGIPSSRPDDEDITSAIIVEGIPPIEDPTYGFVERIYDEEAERFVFFIAGLSVFSTVGAAYYLVSQWTQLDRKYKNREHFMVLLKFEENRRYSIIMERVNS